MQYNCWSLETLRNEDGIKEGNVLDNETKLTVSQYVNRNFNIFRPANLVEPKTWRLWSKIFFEPRRREKKIFPHKILKISVLRLAENAFPTF